MLEGTCQRAVVFRVTALCAGTVLATVTVVGVDHMMGRGLLYGILTHHMTCTFHIHKMTHENNSGMVFGNDRLKSARDDHYHIVLGYDLLGKAANVLLRATGLLP